MLGSIVGLSVKYRRVLAALFVVLLLMGALAAWRLPVDALPDVSGVQVSVLTQVKGRSPTEVERTVTIPIENALNGVPGSVELRSVSRTGLSAVTLVFRDGADVWFARQLVTERLRGLDGALPPGASAPVLAPVSTGLGEIFQFVVRSDVHTSMQLRTLLDWEIVPKLRGVPGVVEVNTMGGELKEIHVVADHAKLRARSIGLVELASAIREANANAGGGSVDRDGEAYVLRGEGTLRHVEEIRDIVLRTEPDGTSILVADVADVAVRPALRYGVITRDGKGEAVTGVVMMLLGSNSRDVVRGVSQKMVEVRAALPPGVVVDVVYDRSDFVERTLGTVGRNLVEGVIVVTLVLWLLLGTVRGSLVVSLGIPASMSIALFGMHIFGVTGDLMSLGAIDFGFLVDGPVVVLEAVAAGAVGTAAAREARPQQYGEIARAVSQPVAFAVAIIMLVYVPLLSLEGVEGKMFRPMALTMASALFGALVYALVFFPALLVLFVPPPGHGPRWVRRVISSLSGLVPVAVRRGPIVLLGATLLLTGSTLAFLRAGADFVPRIFEGDANVTIRRSPSISIDEARDLDLRVERVLASFPEVETTVGMTGRAEVAIDPVGADNTDILVRLRPPSTWTSASSFDDLSERLKSRVEAAVPGSFVSVSQPIEDKTNELISGSRADVSILLSGDDLSELERISGAIGARVRGIAGTGDVRVERLLGQPSLVARVQRGAMARHGVSVADAWGTFEAARGGLHVGEMFEGERRFDVRVVAPPLEPTAAALGDVFVSTRSGRAVTLREVVALTEEDGPAAVRRKARQRQVKVDVNLRGRDLVSWVAEARAVVGRDIRLPPGYGLAWGGQFENFERAGRRLALVIPAVVAIIVGMLFLAFRDARRAIAVSLTVPFALSGGMLGLLARGMGFSLPAAVGFIALGGIAVLNGVVVVTALRKAEEEEGIAPDEAIARAAAASTRAILTTTAVAAFGFVPMALSTGAGAEVQRPLATVVVVGIAVGALVSLYVLPGLLRIFAGPRRIS